MLRSAGESGGEYDGGLVDELFNSQLDPGEYVQGRLFRTKQQQQRQQRENASSPLASSQLNLPQPVSLARTPAPQVSPISIDVNYSDGPAHAYDHSSFYTQQTPPSGEVKFYTKDYGI